MDAAHGSSTRTSTLRGGSIGIWGATVQSAALIAPAPEEADVRDDVPPYVPGQPENPAPGGGSTA